MRKRSHLRQQVRSALAASWLAAFLLLGCGSRSDLLSHDTSLEPAPPAQPMPTLPPPALVGAIRWDAWLPGNDDLGWVSKSLYGRYSHRQPFYGWFSSGLDEQRERDIVRQEIDFAADGGIDYWAFVWYPEESDPQGQIQRPFNHYMESEAHARLHFSLILQADWLSYPDGSWSLYESSFVPYLVSRFGDAQYLKVADERPVVMLFHTDRLPPERLEQLRRATLDAGLAPPYFVDVNMNAKRAEELGLDGLTSYGPSGARPSPGNHCFKVQAAIDERNWGPRDHLQTIVSLTPMADPRPRNYGYSVDQPTRLDWRKHLQRSFEWIRAHPTSVSKPPLLLIYNWNELDEGGPGIVPTLQEGTRYLDDLKAVRTGDTSAYDDVLNGSHCDAVPDGSWTNDFPSQGIAGNRDNDEQVTSIAGSTLTITTESTGFEWVGTLGPDRGQAEVSVDDDDGTLVDLYQPELARRAVIFHVTGLTPGPHTYRIRSLATKNEGALGTTIGVDEIRLRRVGADDR